MYKHIKKQHISMLYSNILERIPYRKVKCRVSKA